MASVPTSTATQANGISPYDLLDLDQAQLAQRFPNMPQRELEKLMFRIADINSMRALADLPWINGAFLPF